MRSAADTDGGQSPGRAMHDPWAAGYVGAAVGFGDADLARPLSDWMPQSYLLTGDGRGGPEADGGAGVFAA